MNVTRDELLQELPPYNNKQVIIEDDQEVNDIVKEVLNAHKVFARDYDYIYQYFDYGSVRDICKHLFDFLKREIRYEVEKEDLQTTKSPAAILALGVGDCKHYAAFIAGVLSAINRNTDRQINWFYRFASYSMWNENVEHVFVVVIDNNEEIWIDPVLSYFDSRAVKPVKILNKKIKEQKMLKRISGTLLDQFTSPGNTVPQLIPFDSSYLLANAQTQSINVDPQTLEPDYYSTDIPENVLEAIKMLLFYGIIDENTNIYNDKYMTILDGLQGQDQIDLANAYGEFLNAAQSNVVGNIWSSIWGTVKQVTLAVPRGAYLSLVSLNVFNLAGHLIKCITNPDGTSDQNGIDKLHVIWHTKLSGDTNILLRAIRNGSQKKAILGIERIGVAAAIPAWVVTASAIIAAMTPIITSILKSKNSFDSLTAAQLGMQPTNNVNPTSSAINQYLPFILLAGVVYYVTTSKRR